MASSTLECLRLHLEDLEQTEAAISTLLQAKYEPLEVSSSTAILKASSTVPNVAGWKSLSSFSPAHGVSLPIYYDVAISQLLKNTQKSSIAALEAFADEDHSRKEEIAYLAGNLSEQGGNAKAGDVWTNFYDRIKYVKDYHRKFNSTLATIADGDTTSGTARSAASIVQNVRTNKNNMVIDGQFFTEEEHGGRRLDLTKHYDEFVNIQAIRHFHEMRHKMAEAARVRKKLALLATRYRTENPDKDELPENLQSTTQNIEKQIESYKEIDYIQYLKSIDNYSDIPRFCKYRNSQYVKYLDNLLAKLQDFFYKTHALAPLDSILKRFTEEFKAKWASEGVTGWQDPPTHQDPLYAIYTDKLFGSSGLFDSHTKGKKYVKLQTASEKAGDLSQHNVLVERSLKHDEELALKEHLIGKYISLMKDALDSSIAHVQKKQSRTAKELEESEALVEVVEAEEDPFPDSDDEDDDEDKPVYNPLSLPYGWDGKPIPFWLYKLHGLGTEYKCAICGNYSYWGRRAFERHFQEWRHAMGMRCLKVPNTAHFKEITEIDDAIALYEKLKKETDQTNFKLEQEMECEDSQGNVMSARAYEDLRRQGLL